MARYKVSGQTSVPLLRENLVPSRNKLQGKEKDERGRPIGVSTDCDVWR